MFWGGAKFPKGKSQLVTFVVFVFVVLCVCFVRLAGALPRKMLQNKASLQQFFAGKIQDTNLDLLHFFSGRSVFCCCLFFALCWVAFVPALLRKYLQKLCAVISFFAGPKFQKEKSQLARFVPVFVFLGSRVCFVRLAGALPRKMLQNKASLHQFYAGIIQDKNLDLLHFCSFRAARWVFAVVCSLRCVGLLLCPRLAQNFVKQCPVTHFLRGQNSQKQISTC